MNGGPRVEFRVASRGRHSASEPGHSPEARAERQQLDRATRRARLLALAHHIDYLISCGQMRDLASVARACGVSRARVSRIAGILEMEAENQERVFRASPDAAAGRDSVT